MAINKVVYGGEVLIDLTNDTVTAKDLKEGVTAHSQDGSIITGTNTFDVDSGDATATVAEILKGKTAYVRGKKLTGTMPNNGAAQGTISTKTGSYTIKQGYHDGSGKVKIDSVEQKKITPENIRQGVTILGIEGSMSGSEGITPQTKVVIPTSKQQIILPDEGYTHLSQVTVEAIPYVSAPNPAGGETVTIG